MSRSTFDTRVFSVSCPTVWNALPDSLRDPAIESQRDRRNLKTHLFAGLWAMSALEVSPESRYIIDIYLHNLLIFLLINMYKLKYSAVTLSLGSAANFFCYMTCLFYEQ